ncbi:hypothetical protein FKW77_005795 [Venturia effusa]|uniref:Uncharacterized protein n=1 Tax=Venturia effusa TaxID=50376 RepID=A0A517LKH9_9PEZI|nr:hypothetical protein FKW77_005795 [Venturia effusa]
MRPDNANNTIYILLCPYSTRDGRDPQFIRNSHFGRRNTLASHIDDSDDQYFPDLVLDENNRTSSLTKQLGTGLLRVNRQIFREVLPVLYSQRLCFKDGYTLQEFLRQSGDKLCLLRIVELYDILLPDAYGLGFDGIPKTAYNYMDLDDEALGQDLDLMFSMLAQAISLQELTMFRLQIPQDDQYYFYDRWAELDDKWGEYNEGDFVEDYEEPLLITGQELATLLLPAARVWFEAMDSQGRDWKQTLTLAKKNTVVVDYFPAVYDHVAFFRAVDSLIDPTQVCNVDVEYPRHHRWIWDKETEHQAGLWLRSKELAMGMFGCKLIPNYIGNEWTEEMLETHDMVQESMGKSVSREVQVVPAHQPPFLKLPAEIRNMIYHYALSIQLCDTIGGVQYSDGTSEPPPSDDLLGRYGLVHHCHAGRNFKLHGAKAINVNLVRVNRQISQEALPILYGNHIPIARHQDGYSFLPSIGTNISLMRSFGFDRCVIYDDGFHNFCGYETKCKGYGFLHRRWNAAKTFELLGSAHGLENLDIHALFVDASNGLVSRACPNLCFDSYKDFWSDMNIINGRGLARVIFPITRAMLDFPQKEVQGFQLMFSSLAKRGSISVKAFGPPITKLFDGEQFLAEMDRLAGNPDGICMDVLDDEATVLWTALDDKEWRHPNRDERNSRQDWRWNEWENDLLVWTLRSTRGLRQSMH